MKKKLCYYTSKVLRTLAIVLCAISATSAFALEGDYTNVVPTMSDGENDVTYESLPQTIKVYWGKEITSIGAADQVRTEDWVTWDSNYPVCSIGGSGSGNYLNLDLSAIQSQVTTWFIYIPAGYVTFADGSTNTFCALQYIVTGKKFNNRTLKVSPETRPAMLDEISEIRLSWSDWELISLDEDALQNDWNQIKFGPMASWGPLNLKTISFEGTGLGNTMVISFATPYTTVGLYELNIPDGVIIGRDASGAQGYNSFTDIYFEVSPVTFDPKDFDVIYGKMEGIKIYAANMSVNAYNAPTVSVDVMGVSSQLKPVFDTYEPITDPQPGYLLKWAQPWEPETTSTVKVTIPANTFKFNNVAYDKALTLEYFHRPLMPAGETYPSQESPTGNLSKVVLYWNDDVLSYPTDVTPGTITLTTGDGSEVDVTSFARIYNEADNSMDMGAYLYGYYVLDLSANPYTAAGEYKINYAGNNIYDSTLKQYNPAQTVTLNVQPTAFPAYNVDVEPGDVEQITGVNISWPDNKVLFFDKSADVTVTLEGTNITTSTNTGGSINGYTVDFDSDGNISVTPYQRTTNDEGNSEESNDPWVEPGEYAITIPAATLLVEANGVQVFNPSPIVLNYTIADPNAGGEDVDPNIYLPVVSSGTTASTVETIPEATSFVWNGIFLADVADAKLDVPNHTKLDINKAHIYINGEEFTAWRNWMGAELAAANVYTTINGDTEEVPVGGRLWVYPGDMAQFWMPKGLVTVTIEEGVVKSTDGRINPELSGQYTLLGRNENVVWSPNTSEEEGFWGGTLTSADAVVTVSWVNENGEAAPVSSLNSQVRPAPFYEVLSAAGESGGHVSMLNMMSVVDGKLQINFSGKPEGRYQLCLTQGAVNLGEGYVNGECYYTLVIKSETTTLEWTSDPAPGETLSAPEDMIRLRWGEATLSLANAAKDIKVMHGDENLYLNASITSYGGEGEEGGDEGSTTIEDNVLAIQLDIDPAGLTDGRYYGLYTVTIPAGAVNVQAGNDSGLNDEIVFSFTVNAEGKTQYLQDVEAVKNIVPSSNPLTSLDNSLNAEIPTYNAINTLTVKWLGGDLSFANAEAGFCVIFNDTDRTPVTPTLTNNALVFNLRDVVLANGDGLYSVLIPDASVYVTVDGVPYFDVDRLLTFKISNDSGVYGIAADADGLYRVYNLNGVNVLTTADSAELGNLSAGIYVINGKKLVVRK